MLTLVLAALAAGAPGPARPWSQAAPWPECEAHDREARSQVLARRRPTVAEGWRQRAQRCARAPWVLVLAAQTLIGERPGIGEVLADPSATPTLRARDRHQLEQAATLLELALLEVRRRGQTPPPRIDAERVRVALALGRLDGLDGSFARLRSDTASDEIAAMRAVAAMLRGDLDAAVRAAHAAHRDASSGRQMAQAALLAWVLDRAGSSEDARRWFRDLRRLDRTPRGRQELEALLPWHERLGLWAIDHEAAGEPAAALRLLDAYLADPEVAAPEREAARRRRAALLPAGPTVGGPGAGPP